jgi:hypothetical protein
MEDILVEEEDKLTMWNLNGNMHGIRIKVMKKILIALICLLSISVTANTNEVIKVTLGTKKLEKQSKPLSFKVKAGKCKKNAYQHYLKLGTIATWDRKFMISGDIVINGKLKSHRWIVIFRNGDGRQHRFNKVKELWVDPTFKRYKPESPTEFFNYIPRYYVIPGRDVYSKEEFVVYREGIPPRPQFVRNN